MKGWEGAGVSVCITEGDAVTYRFLVGKGRRGQPGGSRKGVMTQKIDEDRTLTTGHGDSCHNT